MNSLLLKIKEADIDVKKGSLCLIFNLLITVGILIFKNFGTMYVISMICLTSILSFVSLIDFKIKIIPNELIVLAIILRGILYVGYIFFTPVEVLRLFINNILAALVCSTIFFVGRLFRMGVGAGDVKLYFVIGLYLGLVASFNALFYAVLVMFVYAIIALITKKMKMKDELAVAPFAYLGVLVMFIFSN